MPRRAKSPAGFWRVAAEKVWRRLEGEWGSSIAVGKLAAQLPDATLAVAFSGGADSLALLLTLWAAWPERRAHLVVLHFNHRLRGAASDQDEAFCAAVCRDLGVRCRVGQARWGRAKKKAVGEAEARTARWKFFDREMKAAGASQILLGHHRDDVAETVMMRLARGSGSRGLAAPRPVQSWSDGSTHLRPWLAVPRDALITALTAAGVAWREDASNQTDAFLRNRLRRDVLPAWQKAAGSSVVTAGIARSRALLEEEDLALESWVNRIIPTEPRERWSVTGWAGLPAAVIRRAIYRWLLARRLHERLAPASVDALVAAIGSGEEFQASVGPKRAVAASGGELWEISDRVSTRASSRISNLEVPGEWHGPDGSRLIATAIPAAEWRKVVALARRLGHESTVFLGFSVQPALPLAVRSWCAGDRYVPFGAHTTTKLQDQFVNRRIPRERRGVLPVVTDASGAIFWVPGLPPSASVRVTADSRVLVQLTYQTAHPRSPSHDVR